MKTDQEDLNIEKSNILYHNFYNLRYVSNYSNDIACLSNGIRKTV